MRNGSLLSQIDRMIGEDDHMIIPFKYRMDVPMANNLATKLSHYAKEMQTDEESVIVEALREYLESDQCRRLSAPTINAGNGPGK
jgi:hypothetical protein